LKDSVSEVQEKWVTDKKQWKSIEEYVLFLKQKKAYQFAGKYCKDKYILDYGCGPGYGTALLSKVATKIIGVDISRKVINCCNTTYRSHKTLFKKIYPSCRLPFEDKFFDIIVSFHVIEHIPNVRRYLLELKRVLKDRGILLITTPNKVHRLLPFQKPWNPQHIREYSLKSFKNTLSPIFKKIKMMGVYGTDEINTIECKRVRQSRFRVYIHRPGVKLLQVTLPISFFEFLKNLKRNLFPKSIDVTRSVPEVNLPNKYSLDDFTVGYDVNKCLDFLAICYKK